MAKSTVDPDKYTGGYQGYNYPQYQGGYEEWSGNVYGRASRNSQSIYNNYYPYHNDLTGRAYRTYAELVGGGPGVPTSSLTPDWKLPGGSVVGPGRSLTEFMSEFQRSFPMGAGPSAPKPLTYNEPLNLKTTIPRNSADSAEVPFPTFGSPGGTVSGGGAAPSQKFRMVGGQLTALDEHNIGTRQDGNTGTLINPSNSRIQVDPVAGQNGTSWGGSSAVTGGGTRPTQIRMGGPGGSSEVVEESSYPAAPTPVLVGTPDVPSVATVAPPPRPTPQEFVLPKAPTPKEFTPPAPLQLKGIDENAVAAEAQRQGAPAISKLRQALAHVTTASANEDNPARRRELLRGAMEGAGMSLGDITLASRNAALAKVGKDTDIANRGAEINYQTEVMAGRENTAAANRAAEIAFAAEMTKSGADVDAANRAAEQAFAATMQAGLANAASANTMTAANLNAKTQASIANASSINRSNEVSYAAKMSDLQQQRSLAAQQAMQSSSLASNERLANLSMQTQRMLKEQEMAQSAALMKWSAENQAAQRRIDREETRLLTEMQLENQKILAEWQNKYNLQIANINAQNQYGRDSQNFQQQMYLTLFNTALKDYMSGGTAASGMQFKDFAGNSMTNLAGRPVI